MLKPTNNNAVNERTVAAQHRGNRAHVAGAALNAEEELIAPSRTPTQFANIVPEKVPSEDHGVTKLIKLP